MQATQKTPFSIDPSSQECQLSSIASQKIQLPSEIIYPTINNPNTLQYSLKYSTTKSEEPPQQTIMYQNPDVINNKYIDLNISLTKSKKIVSQAHCMRVNPKKIITHEILSSMEKITIEKGSCDETQLGTRRWKKNNKEQESYVQKLSIKQINGESIIDYPLYSKHYQNQLYVELKLENSETIQITKVDPIDLACIDNSLKFRLSRCRNKIHFTVSIIHNKVDKSWKDIELPIVYNEQEQMSKVAIVEKPSGQHYVRVNDYQFRFEYRCCDNGGQIYKIRSTGQMSEIEVSQRMVSKEQDVNPCGITCPIF